MIRKYTPLLEPLGLTYTQYLAMMVMWEHKSISIRDMGRLLLLDSGTLTPMLKKMEKAGWIQRKRSTHDERVVMVTITAKGEKMQLYTLLHKLMKTLQSRWKITNVQHVR